MKKKVAMQDIADKLNISRVSVSKALNGQPGVSEKLRNKVLKTAAEMGYISKTGKEGEGLLFAFVIRLFKENGDFYNVIYYHLNNLCLKKGHKLLLMAVNDQDGNEETLPEVMLKEDFDGVFLVGQLKRRLFEEATKYYKNVIAVDFYDHYLKTDCILADNFFIGYEATMFLIEHGHRNIGFVGDIFATTSISDRYFGYYKALYMNELESKDEWILCNNNFNTGLYTVDIELPERLPTAFVCHCERAAYYLKLTLEKRGLRVPDDISLIALDKTQVSKTLFTNLTSFAIEQKEFAELALMVMEEKILEPEECEIKRFNVSSRLIDRGSVKQL